MELNAIFTLLAAVAVLMIGQHAVNHVRVLRGLNIPGPVVGGFLIDIANAFIIKGVIAFI